MYMIRVNIAFRVPKEVEYEAIAIATSLAKSKPYYSFLDGVTSLPHVSLYAPVAEEENIPMLLQAVEEIAAQTSSIYLTLKEITTSQGFVGIEFGLIPDAKRLQDKLISVINPLRAHDIVEKYKDGIDYGMELSLGSLQSLEKYGSVGVINFHPHLTLFRLKDETDAQLAKRKVKWSIPRFLVGKVGVFEMGESGVCRELIAEFPLHASL